MTKINIVLFGVGNVGGTFIKQILSGKQQFQNAGIEINIPVIANSKNAFFEKKTVDLAWKTNFSSFGFNYQLEDVLNYVKQQDYENLVAIDATASDSFVGNYRLLVSKGFHIVAANKVANTLSSEFYKELRKTLEENNRYFYYETNVGAGLPVIQTLQSLHQSGENIRKIRGVFSGSMSYIFNTFSEEDKLFSEVLTEAREQGLTEPDPRVDLSGKDVGRKLLILARELDLVKELSDINIKDLVPKHLNGNITTGEFLSQQEDLNHGFNKLKEALREDEVIRHVGELDVTTGSLEVKLVTEKKNSAFGSLKNADSSFEIYSESYGKEPLVIQGAGAGSEVTARGVLTDVIKLTEQLKNKFSICI